MYGPQVLETYDIIVSMPQRALNTQLAALAQQGVIPNKLRLMQQTDDHNNYSYVAFASEAELPKGADGAPSCPYIDADIQPSINITQDGTVVTLVLQFTGGTAQFQKGLRMVKHDPTGWRYGVAINLDLQAIALNDLGQSKVVPPLVDTQLRQFSAQMFDVSHLFLNFNASDLMSFDPANTHAPGSDGSDAQPDLTLFMQFYLKHLKDQPNGFILGYVPTVGANTQIPSDRAVPDTLKPVGTTYLVRHNASAPDQSTLNYAIATKGGHGAISGSPSPVDFDLPGSGGAGFNAGIQAMHLSMSDIFNNPHFFPGFFPAPPVYRFPSEQFDASVAYSHKVLLEALILRPFFQQVHDGPYAQISTVVETHGPGLDYDHAVSQPGPGSWQFNIADDNVNDDLYKCSFAVHSDSNGQNVTYTLGGQIYAQKEKSENCFFCTAEATSTIVQNWSGQVTLNLVTGADGQPTIQVGSNFNIPPLQGPDNWHNGCAKAVDILGDILGAMTSLGGLLNINFFSNLFSTVSIDGMGDLGSALRNMSSVVQGVILLPTGTALRLDSLASDSAGNVWVGAHFPPASLAASVPAATPAALPTAP